MITQITNLCSKAIFKNLPIFNVASTLSIKMIKYSFAKQKQEVSPMTAKFSQIGSVTKQDTVITNGRSWLSKELRIKSTQDLNKLWYVCVRQKNILLADKAIQQKNNNKDISKYRLKKLQKTMARILTIISQRTEIRKQYRQKLQLQYIEKKRAQLEKQVKSQPQPIPQITWDLLRTKYHELRKGIDNVDYLQKIWEKRQNYVVRKEASQQRLKTLTQDNQKFKSFWQKQMTFKERPTQQQILRSHVNNWRQLNLKQRKIILGFLNAKRAKDAKKTFVKQLKYLGQKLAQQQMKDRTSVQA